MKTTAPLHGTWSALAALFAEDVAEAVGQAAGTIASLLGPEREVRHEGTGEVDGYAGFTRRGSYERLLISEWLLADEAPDEFLRRAATNTHAFHALARRRPETRPAMLVLLDSGPDQIGGPRLGHVATLVALDRRAARNGAKIAWTFLSTPEAPPRTEIDSSTFAGFVAAHTDRRPERDAAARALARASSVGPFSEVWLVGSRGLEAQLGMRDARRLVFEDAFDPKKRALDVAFVAPGQPTRRAELAIPDGPLAVRMLRDPFETKPHAQRTMPPPAPTKHVLELSRGIHLSPTGSRLLGVTVDGTAIACGVSGQGTSRPIAPRLFRPVSRDTVVAVGYSDKQLLSVTLGANQLTAHGKSRRGEPAQIAAPGAYELLDGPVGLITPMHAASDDWAVHHPRATLEITRRPEGNRVANPSRVHAVVTHRTGSAKRTNPVATYRVRTTREGALQIEGFSISTYVAADHTLANAASPVRVFAASALGDGGSYVAYVADGGANVTLVARGPDGTTTRATSWPISALSELVGIVPARGTAAFVVRSAPMTVSVLAAGPSALRTVFEQTFARPIVHIACASEAPVIAVATEDGLVRVFDVTLTRLLITIPGRIR